MPISIGTDTALAVFGYAAEGRSALRWLAQRGCRNVRIVSTERPADLPPETPWLSDGDAQSALDGVGVLVKSPGVRPDHPVLRAAADRGVAVTSSTVLFVEQARASGVTVIGVTGSKGKSTTATLIHRTLERAGVPVVLVGNIGRPALDLYDDVVTRRPVVVFEMSSYQTHDLTIGPPVAVITRLFPEHLDWHGSVEAYYASKLKIASTQAACDVTLWNAADPELSRRAPFGPARHVPFGAGPVEFDTAGMKLRGLHNVTNARGALAAATLFGATTGHLESVLRSFSGLPHRLEDLGVHGGIRWINDSIATAPEAGAAALEAFGHDVATFIGGGTDRGFDFTPLVRALRAAPPANIVLLPPGGPAILETLRRSAPELVSRARLVPSLDDAVAFASTHTPAGATVLFSPSSPSYGVFRNFEQRGDAFRHLVAAL